MKSVTKVSALSQVAKSLANSEPVSFDPVLTLNDAEKTMIIEYVQVNNSADKKNQQLAELLYSQGKRSYHFVGANDADKGLVGFRNNLINTIVKGFDADAQKLYHAEPKTLNVSKSAERTVLVTKIIPTRFGNIKKAMVAFENAMASGKEGKAKPKTKEQLAKQALLQFIKYAKESKNCWEGFSKDIEMAQSFSVLKQIK